MKIYFTGSLHNKDVDKILYHKIVSLLEADGYKVKSDHILKVTDIDTQSQSKRSIYYNNLTKWISASDIMVCEVSYPSTINIGHEVSLALEMKKPILALYQKGRPPRLLEGVKSDKLLLTEYSIDSLKEQIRSGLVYLLEKRDTRFTMLISPEIVQHLDFVSTTGISRSDYIRKLIYEDIKDIKR